MHVLKAFFQWIVIGATYYASASLTAETKKERYARSILFENRWPDPDPNIVRFPHQVSCHHYYLVLSAEDIAINRCPNGELFDYLTHDCVTKELARCWSHHFGKLKHIKRTQLHKKKKQFRCPYPWGKYPDVHDCTKYYQCLNGKTKHKKCAPYEYFDKIAGKCVASIKAICADETDVVEHGYKCPRSWGQFPFHKDCSKYYECLEGKAVLRTCRRNTLFDRQKKKCLSKEHAKCVLEDIPEGNIDSSVPTKEIMEDTTSIIAQENTSREEVYEVKSVSFDPQIYTNIDVKTSSVISSTSENEADVVKKISTVTPTSSMGSRKSNFFFL